MIKFFRKIRQDMIKDNRASKPAAPGRPSHLTGRAGKYLLYAVGEILLVVIGILIALQVNNWNETKKEVVRSQDYMQRILLDLGSVSEQAVQIKERSKRTLNSLNEMIEIIKRGSMEEGDDEIISYSLIWMTRYNYRTPSFSTLEEMKSTGDLKLIYDVDLRNDLITFNSGLELNNGLLDDLGNDIRSYGLFLKDYMRRDSDSETLEVTVAYNFDKMKKDEGLINVLSEIALNWRAGVYFYGLLERDALELKERIKQNIDTIN